MRTIIDLADKYVQDTMRHDCTGHDYLHVDRVRKMALTICREENSAADGEVVELVALLHDVNDAKRQCASPSAGALIVKWGGSEQLGRRVDTAIAEVGFKGGFNSPPTSVEAEIVQDADRLDALGAIGIARAFAYGGHAGQKPLDPEIPVQLFTDEKAYCKLTGTTVNHFHEKLFRLPALLHTATAKRIAEKRVAFMREFLRQLGDECGYDFFPSL